MDCQLPQDRTFASYFAVRYLDALQQDTRCAGLLRSFDSFVVHRVAMVAVVILPR